MRVLLLAMLLLGCEGVVTGPGGGRGAGSGGSGGAGAGTGGAGGGDGLDGGSYLSNGDVYTRLKVTCGGCHTMDMRPFFADLTAFENLIVYDTRWVTPGNPASSGLIGLMRGTVGRQMPPVPSERFEVLSSRGLTRISLAEVEEWILNLPARGDAGTPFDPVSVRRKSAEQIRVALYEQLGLVEADFFNVSSTAGIPYRWDAKFGDLYALRSSDETPYSDPFDQGGSLYSSLGGAFWLEGKLSSDAVTPNMLQALVPISQAWCREAFNKAGNTAVLNKATLADASASAAGIANIKANIAYLYLRMLGERPGTAEVDDLYTSVFVPYEARGTATAWTAVCAALVRDPLWILY